VIDTPGVGGARTRQTLIKIFAVSKAVTGIAVPTSAGKEILSNNVDAIGMHRTNIIRNISTQSLTKLLLPLLAYTTQGVAVSLSDRVEQELNNDDRKFHSLHKDLA
jgi:hypothetical protein